MDAVTLDARQAAHNAYEADLTNAWRHPQSHGTSEFIGAREGDLCTVREGGGKFGVEGAPGHLKMINGVLTCVADPPLHSQSRADSMTTDHYAAYDAELREMWKHPK